MTTQKILFVAAVAAGTFAAIALFQAVVMPVPVIGRFLPRAA